MRYTSYLEHNFPKVEDKKIRYTPTFYRKLAKYSSILAKFLGISGLILVILGYAPSVVYQLAPHKFNISELILRTTQNPDKSQIGNLIDPASKKEIYQPVFDSNLPEENKISMPSVKIETKINEASRENYEDALRIGVWRVSDFGTPYARERPTILSAHRYGYLKWSVPYRLKNSFYNLPKLKVGDKIEIIWLKRKYTYEVYAEDKGTEIKDYSADLILYTCESLNSDIRIIRYAKLLEI